MVSCIWTGAWVALEVVSDHWSAEAFASVRTRWTRTAGAAYYLAKKWKRLHRVYEGVSVYVAVEFPFDDFRASRVIAEGALQ